MLAPASRSAPANLEAPKQLEFGGKGPYWSNTERRKRAATYKEGSSEDEDRPEDHQPDHPEASKSSPGREGGGPEFG
jgi:hypothetical protein